MEYEKFEPDRVAYHRGLEAMEGMGFSFYDHVHHAPAFAGHRNIGRFLALYETYKATLGVAGHIAEVGVWKASSLLYFAKLTLLFEPDSLTLVHGFDWYRGMALGPDERTKRVEELLRRSCSSQEEGRLRNEKEALELYKKIKRLIEVQRLHHVVHLHKIDVRSELPDFFAAHPQVQFKIVFLDAGSYDVTRACLVEFWPRLVSGGILLLDQFGHEISPGETRAVREYLPSARIRTFPFSGHPSAYIAKP